MVIPPLSLSPGDACKLFSTRRHPPAGAYSPVHGLHLASTLACHWSTPLPSPDGYPAPAPALCTSQALLFTLNMYFCHFLPVLTTTMRAVLLRTGSVPFHSSLTSASPRMSPVHFLVTGPPSPLSGSPCIFVTMHRHQREFSSRRIRRALSESDIIRSDSGISGLKGVGSRSFPAWIAEDDDDDEGRPLVVQPTSADRVNYAVSWPEIGIPLEEIGFSGGGADGSDSGSFTGGGNGDWQKLAAYYVQRNVEVKSRRCSSFKKLWQILTREKDSRKAEEYYDRAILASPGDGEVLSLFAKLIWDTERHHGRAKYYFDQAVSASPNDCMVVGSYAQFMWETEEKEEGENEAMKMEGTMVEAF